MLIRLALTEIQSFKVVEINKEMYGHPDAESGCHTFLFKFDIFKWLYLAYYNWLYLHQTWSSLYDYVDQ